MYGHIWSYMAMYGHVWPYMDIYRHIWPYMDIYSHIWPYIAIYGHICGHIWPYMAICGHILAIFLNFFIDVCDGTGGARVGRRNVAHIDEKIGWVAQIGCSWPKMRFLESARIGPLKRCASTRAFEWCNRRVNP